MQSIKRNITFLLIPFLVIAFVFSCKKQSPPPNMHLNYFGLTPGRFVIYDVKEIAHDVDLNPQHDTIIYQLKTLIGDEYIDNQDRKAREFKRYKRNTNSEPWVLTDVWSAIIENYKAELIEENQRIIKLVFSPTVDKNWNPNAFNSFDEMDSYYTNIHKQMTISNLSFDSTLTVQQEYFTSLIDYQNQYEVYATNIGLVSKTYKNLKIANFDTLNVKKGNEIHYKCIEYGFE